MHETVFSKEIIRVIRDKLRDLDNNSKISCVNVRLSPLSHVRPEALKSAFLQVASQQDLLGKITLNIEPSEVKLQCRSCGRESLVKQPVIICPDCNSEDFDIKQGKEFFIESVEIERET
jgi:hydrogenase nickel incorporation protein HypA/HybF